MRSLDAPLPFFLPAMVDSQTVAILFQGLFDGLIIEENNDLFTIKLIEARTRKTKKFQQVHAPREVRNQNQTSRSAKK